MGFVEIFDGGIACRIEACCGQNQDRGVDQQCEGKGNRRVECCKAYCFALFRQSMPVIACLNDAGMQIEVMRHHGRTNNAQCYIEHIRIADDFCGWRKTADHFAPLGFCHQNLDQEAERNDAEQRDDERFDPTKALVLEIENKKHVCGGNDDADFQRNAEKQIEADCRTDNLGKIGGADGKFCQKPQRPGEKAWIGIAAGLSEIATGCNRKPGA